jgi:hypothetical protein
MRNILLAITSFFATVLILSQVALAQSNAAEDPVAAQGEDPNLSINKSAANVEAGVAKVGNDCPTGTCFKNTVDCRRGDYTNPKTGTATSPGSHGQEGRQ